MCETCGGVDVKEEVSRRSHNRKQLSVTKCMLLFVRILFETNGLLHFWVPTKTMESCQSKQGVRCALERQRPKSN